MQRQEISNNTDEQVEEYVTKALNLVRDLDPAPDLRAALFEQACQMYASKHVVLAQTQAVDLGALRGNGPRF